ncbi:MAG: pyridoxal-phosphate dependent enzyme [Bacteroidota bacterium]
MIALTTNNLQKLESVPSIANIQHVHEAIAPYIHRTPILTCESINAIAGAELYFKCENFQKIGAFKMRGATSAALALSEAEIGKGLATHSSGNHAQAVALTAKNLGTKAYIVMPSNSPAVKKKAVAGYGAEITFCEPTQAAREATMAEIVAETGATFIHPYDDYNVIAGQATCAKEVFEDCPILDAIIAPIGGGGLMSGTALSAKYFSPMTKIYGGEPEIVNDAYRSLQSGQLQQNTTTDTIADGLKTNLSDKTFGIIQEHLEEIILVNETEIADAMRLIWERMKIIIEPSCAVPLAAILKHPAPFSQRKVGLILTGGNVDLEKLPFTKH